jgi:hypothetical protein
LLSSPRVFPHFFDINNFLATLSPYLLTLIHASKVLPTLPDPYSLPAGRRTPKSATQGSSLPRISVSPRPTIHLLKFPIPHSEFRNLRFSPSPHHLFLSSAIRYLLISFDFIIPIL